MMEDERLTEKLRAKSEDRASEIIEEMLESPMVHLLTRAVKEVQTYVSHRGMVMLNMMGLPSQSEVRKVGEVLSRSGRKMAEVEKNLARIEILLGSMDAIPVEAVSSKSVQETKASTLPDMSATKPAAPQIQKTIRKQKAAVKTKAKPPKKKAAPATMKAAPVAAKKARAKPVAPARMKKTPSSKKTTPQDILLSPLGAGKKLSEVAVKPGKGKPPRPKGAEMLSGFDFKTAKKTRKKKVS